MYFGITWLAIITILLYILKTQGLDYEGVILLLPNIVHAFTFIWLFQFLASIFQLIYIYSQEKTWIKKEGIIKR